MATTQLTKISSVIPCLRYRDAGAAIDWLVRAFGLTEAMVAAGPDGEIQHAELTCDPEGNLWSFGTYRPVLPAGRRPVVATTGQNSG